MKKMLFALFAVLLSVFITGCGKSPDEELTEKVPASANFLCLVDGNSVVQTQLYKEHQKDILKELKDAKLPEDLFQCRVLLFGSTKEEWGGALVQSVGGQVRKFYDLALAEAKKTGKIKELKELSEGGIRRVTGVAEGKKFLAVLYHDNLLLVAVERTDPAFYKAAPVNPLFREIRLKETIISSAVKVELPPQGKNKEVDGAVQMLPALKKLQSVAMNVPFSADKPEMDFRMIFQDEPAANEMLAAVNMGLGFLTQSGDKDAVDIVGMITRKVEKNAVCISFPIAELVKAVCISFPIAEPVKAVDKAQKSGAKKAKRGK